MPVDLAAVRERLAALAEQWRPSSPPVADADADLDDGDVGSADRYRSRPPVRGPSRSPVRGLVTLLAALAVVVGWWWWQGRPRAVVAAPEVLAAGQPLTGATSGPTTPSPAPPPASPAALPPAPQITTPGDTSGPVPTAPTPTPGAASLGAVVVVHVAGPVRLPGVVRVPVGSRVVDAVEAAGGLRPGADVGPVNLARLVVDGERIDLGRRAVPQPSSGPTATGPAAPDPPVGAGGPLDLNTATQAELEELPGVGPVLAGRILAWRSEHGRFSAVEELQEVAGIGDATYAELAPLVRV